jgi:hypothetical protein
VKFHKEVAMNKVLEAEGLIDDARRANYIQRRPGKKSMQAGDEVSGASQMFAQLSKALAIASEIADGHSDFIGGVSPSLYLDDIRYVGRRPVIVFSSAGRDEIECEWDANRSRWIFTDCSRTGTSSLEVIKATGCSQDYLDGITEALSIIAHPDAIAQFCNDRAKDRVHDILMDQELDKGGSTWEWCDENMDILRYIVNHGVNRVKQQVEHLPPFDMIKHREDQKRLSKTLSEATEKLLSVCSKHQMPEVPAGEHSSLEVRGMEGFPGVYFAWEHDECFYVGRSVDIPQRMRSHEKVRGDQKVSWLRCSVAETYTWELFYIWLLDPQQNSECLLASKAAVK